MNALETAAMLDKITDSGGSVKLIDGKPVARNVPAHFLANLAANRDSVIRILEGQQNLPKPVARKRAVLRFDLAKGGGSVSGSDDETVATLLAALREKWSSDLIGAWHDDVRVWP